SLPYQIDSSNPNLGRYSATRRVARTLFFGSAPTFEAADRGLDLQRIKLGSVYPMEPIAVFSDALRHLTDRATYVYVQTNHYWYSDKNNVTRTAEERAGHIKSDTIDEEIYKNLSKLLVPVKDQFTRIHIMPETSGDIPDEMEMKLVVLGTKVPHVVHDADSIAYAKAKEILNTRGNSQRLYRNTLVFLAADKTRLVDLNLAVRNYLAWKSIIEDKVTLNLDAFQNKQAEEKVTSGLDTIKLRLPETFIWILTPFQELGASEVKWDETKIVGSGQDSLNARIIRKLVNQSQVYNDLAATELRISIDKIPLWSGNDISIRQLREYFAKYLYLPKLLTADLLKNAIEDGISLISWTQDAFAYADSYDKEKNRYKGLSAGKAKSISLDSIGLIVKPDVAMAQLTIEQTESITNVQAGLTPTNYPPAGTPGHVSEDEKPVIKLVKKTRCFGHVEISPIRFYRDAENIEKEILKHLSGITGTDVRITIHFEAENDKGFTHDIERTIKENGKTLGFGEIEFE
ncbi:MAG: AAA+ family ATPase, partial [Bacteroidales bacterium]|nr:AAA+ family ATPase [Bacteroidales bacterium]